MAKVEERSNELWLKFINKLLNYLCNELNVYLSSFCYLENYVPVLFVG